jgi:hypothetical protein
MSFVAVAIGGSALIGAGASMITGNKAASAQERAAQEAAAVQKYMYDTTREDYRPYREVGYKALDKLSGMYGVGGQITTGTTGGAGSGYGGFEASPGYQFRMDEAMKAIERSAAARGGLRSGATMDALQRRAQGVASGEFENYANRLAALAGVGQSATGSTAQAGQNYASGASQAITNAGNARASAYQNVGNSINAGVQNMASAFLYGKGYGGNSGGNWYDPIPGGYR